MMAMIHMCGSSVMYVQTSTILNIWDVNTKQKVMEKLTQFISVYWQLKKHVLILGKLPIDELNDTALIKEYRYSFNITKSQF